VTYTLLFLYPAKTYCSEYANLIKKGVLII